jgi:hypothetical protein
MFFTMSVENKSYYIHYSPGKLDVNTCALIFILIVKIFENYNNEFLI